MNSPAAVGVLPRRDWILISGCILLITALAWLYLVRVDREMSSAMEHDRMMAEMGMPMEMPWTAEDAWLTFAMWFVMMVGMMAPSAAPALLLFAAAHSSRRDERRAPFAAPMFGLGYAIVWAAFSACATLAQWALHQSAMLSPAMAASSPRVGGVILIAAGAYQLTPWKSACLKHCRSPLGFLMSSWRGGTVGALRMGASHGVYCLGCCWALMCVLFAVGVMNLAWVAALTVFVLLEKTGPAGGIVARVAGAAMVVFGIAAAAGWVKPA